MQGQHHGYGVIPVIDAYLQDVSTRVLGYVIVEVSVGVIAGHISIRVYYCVVTLQCV
jgi:hypothetical protein